MARSARFSSELNARFATACTQMGSQWGGGIEEMGSQWGGWVLNARFATACTHPPHFKPISRMPRKSEIHRPYGRPYRRDIGGALRIR